MYFASFMQQEFQKNLVEFYIAIKKDFTKDKLVSLCKSINYMYH